MRYPTNIVQSGVGPVFVCRATIEANLDCEHCGNNLVSGYLPECFVGLAFRCYRCKDLTKTGSLEDGELIARNLMIFPDGEIALTKIEYSPHHCITTEYAAETYVRRCAPAQVPPILQIDPRRLEHVIARYDHLSKGSLSRQRRELSRYRGNIAAALDLPFA